MKRKSLIAVLAAMIVMISATLSYAANDFTLVSSYPEDGQKDTSIENLGVKLNFNKALNSKEAKKSNAGKIIMKDDDGKNVPIKVLYSNSEEGLVLAIADIDVKEFKPKNNAEYSLIISADFTDNEGNTLGKETVISFKTYNQKVNNIVNMGMMIVLFGGITVLSIRQNKKKDEDILDTDSKESSFNPYREAKRTGRSVEEVIAEQEKKEAKLAKKKSKKAKEEESIADKKIEKCSEYLKNVYHVPAPAPISKEDRSIEALRAMRREEKASRHKKARNRTNRK
ncbi:MAG TPA: Ig-like domain-containing protein [Mogibacterium sp.]|nr:Ig-like domain-containing protein [Mogibacterium sp.]